MTYFSGSFMVSDQCNFSGENTVFFYPDCRTAIVGTFGPGGQLKSGHVTEIVGVLRDAAQNPEPVYLAPDTDVSIFFLPYPVCDRPRNLF